MIKIKYSLNTFHIPIDILKEKIKKCSIFLLHGNIGSGKTTFIKAFLQEIGIHDVITSPTFTYVNTYYSKILDKNIYHFDLYRLVSIDEFYDLLLHELLEDNNALIFIEWPELLINYLKDNGPLCELFFNYNSDLETRTVKFIQH